MAVRNDPERSYLKDELDWEAFDFYVAQRGMHPPTRPDGFLDEWEQKAWDCWRKAAKWR